MINNKSNEILNGLIEHKNMLERSEEITNMIDKYGVINVLMRIEVYYEDEYKSYIENNGIKGIKI